MGTRRRHFIRPFTQLSLFPSRETPPSDQDCLRPLGVGEIFPDAGGGENLSAMEQCTHQRTEIRRRTIANGVKILQRQCLDCGASVGNALSQQKMSVEERHAFSLWDEELFNRIEVERKAEWEKLRAASMAEEEEKDAAWWATMF